MKKIVTLLFAGLIIVSLTGCDLLGKPLTKEQQLCKDITPSINSFNNGGLTYDGFLEAIKTKYNETCTDNTNNVCITIKSMYSMNNISYEQQDCSKYNVNDSLGKSMKELCESSNKLRKDLADKREASEKAHVNDLQRVCNLENEN